jgi:hypothetical protein
LPSATSSKRLYGRNNAYKFIVFTLFDGEKSDAKGVVVIITVDLLKRESEIFKMIYLLT